MGKYKYWQDPRLDDEGTYDYLVQELPKDYAEWDWLYRRRCDNCGKYRLCNCSYHHFFYCWDGWDDMNWTECWVCTVKNRIIHYKCKIRNVCKRLAITASMYFNSTTKMNWKNCYKIAKTLK